jgi:FAD-NAD(P)-binding
MKELFMPDSLLQSNFSKKTVDIGIIGAGARGLSILERIIAFARAGHFSTPITVHIFDRQFGPGCHGTEQSDHLLVNTIASQITIFSDSTVQGSGLLLNGPSFYEWLSDQATDFTPEPNAYYSRKLLGKYLEWSFNYLCEIAPELVKIVTISWYVNSIIPIHESIGFNSSHRTVWDIQSDSGQSHIVDFIFLTTGHEYDVPTVEQADRRLFPAYPLNQSTANIQPHETVAIEGLGLSTCDVISMLTVGRGGKFFRDITGQLCYQKSHQEPQIIGFSRSGLPLSARAKNEKEVREQYKAFFLTREAISCLKEQYEQLDFETQLLPLLLADMEFMYSKTYIQKYQGYIAAHQFANRYLNATEAQRKALIVLEIPLNDRFNWAALTCPIPVEALNSQIAFSDWLAKYLQDDLSAANEGNISNPLKAACDVLRDVRDNLRHAIDFAGLTEQSHRHFIQNFLPVMNRLAVGPPKIRLEEMIALQSAGVLKMDLGPQPQWRFDEDRDRFVIEGRFETLEVDIMIRSRIAMPPPQESSNLLVRQLIQDGIAQPFMNGQFQPNGLDVSRDLNLINPIKGIHPNFWVLGTPIEGPKFYTFILPRPFVNSTALVDADRVVQSLRDQVHQLMYRYHSQFASSQESVKQQEHQLQYMY